MNANPVDRNNTLSGKRNCDDFDLDLDIEELLDLPPLSKKERICDKEEDGVELQKVEEADIEDYMQHEHTTTEPTLEFSVTPHRKTIGIRSSEVITQICATIKACELPLGVHARAPVDIVVALDVSGSMRVEKLDLCKKTLKLLLHELHHDDRFCLISFSDEAKIELPMMKINDEQKLIALHTIDHLQVRGRTNIASAVSLAAQVANGVKNPNKVRSVFLLTDGVANVGYTEATDLIELTKIFVESDHKQNTPPISLHTFGYGQQPDSQLLQNMANATLGGSFYAVKDNSQGAFGDAIGGILSVVAHNVILTISVPEIDLIDVYHDKKNLVSDKVLQVNLGDIYAEETRDVLFEVSLACPRSHKDTELLLCHATVQLSYTDTIKHSVVGPLIEKALISRPNSSELGWPNQHVAIQWLRVRTANVISNAEQSAKMGEVDKAKRDLSNWIQEFEKDMFEIGGLTNALLDQLHRDCKESLALLKRTNYNAYVDNDLGVRCQAHLSQRCSQPLIRGKSNVYRTAQKALRAQQFDQM